MFRPTPRPEVDFAPKLHEPSRRSPFVLPVSHFDPQAGTKSPWRFARPYHRRNQYVGVQIFTDLNHDLRREKVAWHQGRSGLGVAMQSEVSSSTISHHFDVSEVR